MEFGILRSQYSGWCDEDDDEDDMALRWARMDDE